MKATRYMRQAQLLLSAATVILLAACDEPTTIMQPQPVPVAVVDVTPGSPTLRAGESIVLTATPRDAAGRPLQRAVTWRSSNSAVASVTEAGTVQAVTAGTATISASTGGRTGSAQIAVTVVPVGRIEVKPGAAILSVGETRQYSALFFGLDGERLPDQAVTWRVDGEPRATVNAQGLVTALEPGYITVIASANGLTGAVGATIVMPEGEASKGRTLARARR